METNSEDARVTLSQADESAFSILDDELVAEDEGFFMFAKNVWNFYDHRTMFLIAMQFFNEAGTVMMSIACTLFFIKRHISPIDAVYYMCVISLPEALCFFFGMFIDSVSIYGKRGHILLASSLQMIMSLILIFVNFNGEDMSIWWFVACVTLLNCGKAWLTPTIESIMVMQIKIDPERGAEDIETFGVVCQGIGALIFCVLGGYLMNPNKEDTHSVQTQPLLYFAQSGMVGLIIFIAGAIYPKQSEEHQTVHSHGDHQSHESNGRLQEDQSHESQSTTEHGHPVRNLSLGDKLLYMWKIIKLYKVRKTLIFIFIASATQENWEVFLTYSNEEQYHITPFFEGGMVTIVLVISSFWLILYNSTFANRRTRWFSFVAIIMRLLSVIIVSRMVRVPIDHHPSKKRIEGLFAVNSLLFQPLYSAYLIKPAAMVFAKCVPHSIEGLMMGFVNSIVLFNQEILMRLFSLFVIRNLHISIDDYKGLSYHIIKSSFWTGLLPLLILKFLIDRKEIVSLQVVIEKMDQMNCADIRSINIDQRVEFLEKQRRIQRGTIKKRETRVMPSFVPNFEDQDLGGKTSLNYESRPHQQQVSGNFTDQTQASGEQNPQMSQLIASKEIKGNFPISPQTTRQTNFRQTLRQNFYSRHFTDIQNLHI